MCPIKCDKKSDKQLVKQTLKNADYFACLVDKYEEKLNRYIRRLTNFDNETVEDLLQETFLKAYKNLNDYDPSFSFNSWIYRIAHNETISYFRKTKSRPETVNIENEEGVSFLNILPSDINLREDYVKKELARKVHKLIGELPEKYRAVLILKFLEEKNYDEICDIMQIPPGTVATLIHRAKAQFKQLAIKHHLNKSDN